MLNDLRRGSWYFIINNTVSECIYFLMKHVFSKTVLTFITFTKCINQLPLLNTFSFLFPHTFYLSASSLFNFNLSTSSLLIYFIITCQFDFPLFQALYLLTVSIFFPELLAISCRFLMLWMLITKYKAKFTLWMTLIKFTT